MKQLSASLTLVLMHIGCSLKKPATLLILAVTLLLASGFDANAAPLTNGSFELPLNVNNTAGVAPTDFVTTTNGNYFESHGSSVFETGFSALNAEDGSQFLQLSGAGSSVYQDLGLLDANSTYTLTIGIGKGGYSGGIPDSLISLLNGTDLSGTSLGSYNTSAITFNSDPNGVTPFVDASFTITTGASVSGDLTFAIQTLTDPHGTDPAGSSTIAFDNVRLLESGGSSVPEPSTWALMFGGLVALVGLQRLRRQSSKA